MHLNRINLKIPHDYVQNNPKIAPKPGMFAWTDGGTLKISDGIT